MPKLPYNFKEFILAKQNLINNKSNKIFKLELDRQLPMKKTSNVVFSSNEEYNATPLLQSTMFCHRKSNLTTISEFGICFKYNGI